MPGQGWAYERFGIVGTIDPQTITTVELFTDVIDMSKWHEVMAIALTGDLATSTLTFTAYTCASDGSGAVALTGQGKQVTLGSSATANDNVQEIIDVKAEE